MAHPATSHERLTPNKRQARPGGSESEEVTQVNRREAAGSPARWLTRPIRVSRKVVERYYVLGAGEEETWEIDEASHDTATHTDRHWDFSLLEDVTERPSRGVLDVGGSYYGNTG